MKIQKKLTVDKRLQISLKHRNLKILRQRAQRRWSALLHRIGTKNKLKVLLGQLQWDSFVEEARARYYSEFLARFNRRKISCEGPLGGENRHCIHGTTIFIESEESMKQIKDLHLDHEFDIKQTLMCCHVRLLAQWGSCSLSGRYHSAVFIERTLPIILERFL
uniref:Uncharacterized protein n=1 Tax=Aplanochytrium stocchinoi TaxID=215587 RepID=A0A7S3V254_9STRA|mmetsp:Transcript_7421/g.9406  ORF Transcript_7421/g.9406 Transcript_7421/m.9406 type:complete len:163 (+) Transcript_7421:106-594(+)